MNKSIMKNFYKIVTFLIILASITMISVSCGNDELKTENLDNIEVPPSISQKSNDEVKYINLNKSQIEELKIKTVKITKEHECIFS